MNASPDISGRQGLGPAGGRAAGRVLWPRRAMQIALMALCFGLGTLAAYPDRTIYVSLTGTNHPPFANWADAATNLIWAVNAATNGDSILITNGHYGLTSVVDITKGIRVASVNGAGATTLDGNNAVRCFNLHSNAVLDGLTIAQGRAERGGGIYCTTGIVVNCVITGNVATTNANFGGGGIYAVNVLLATNCTLINNTASNRGGGVYAYSAGITFLACSFITNGAYQGGGIWGAYIAATNCTFSMNQASYTGGGLENWYNGTVAFCTFSNNAALIGGGISLFYSLTNNLVTNCTVVNNTAAGGGGGIYVNGLATIQDSRVAGNATTNQAGGGINLVYQGASGQSVIRNCVISSNSAMGAASDSYGGGIYADGSSTCLVEKCVFNGNRASRNGGGIYLGTVRSGSVVRNCLVLNNTAGVRGGGVHLRYTGGRLINCTVVSNSAYTAGGICTEAGSATCLVANTVVFLNTATDANSNWYNFAAAVYSNCCTMPTNGLSGTGNIQSDPLLLGPADSNYRLAASSPCINRGSNEDWMAAGVDLDGYQRLDRFSRIVDLGAYEFLPSGTLIVFP